MKATIRYQPLLAVRFGGKIHTVDEGNREAIVRVAEITHVEGITEKYSRIFLTNDKILLSATPLDELERRIDAAEAAEIENR